MPKAAAAQTSDYGGCGSKNYEDDIVQSVL